MPDLYWYGRADHYTSNLEQLHVPQPRDGHFSACFLSRCALLHGLYWTMWIRIKAGLHGEVVAGLKAADGVCCGGCATCLIQ